MPNNFIIMGNPRSGKSTLVENVLKELNKRKIGFFTREVRKDGSRIGFDIVLPSGKTVPLARIDFNSDYRVSKYYQQFDGLQDAQTQHSGKPNLAVQVHNPPAFPVNLYKQSDPPSRIPADMQDDRTSPQ